LLLPDTELLSIPDEEDEADLDQTTEYKSPENEFPSSPSPVLNINTSIPIRPWSDFSLATTSIPSKYFQSRSYKFIQLEQSFISANLIQTKDDRMKFKNEYLQSIRENKFEEFLQKSYQILNDHYIKMKRERAIKKAQTFTFVDLEKNFLSLDPTRDIKIVFIDDPTPKTLPYSPHRNSALSNHSDYKDNVDGFYESQSRYLLRNPSYACDEIILFARRSGEQLHQHLPHLSRVPHRVKIIDQRETKRNIDQHSLLQMKHKHNLSLITKRRQLVDKMFLQNQKNQNKIKQFMSQTPLTISNSFSCRELLEQVNHIEQQSKISQTESNSPSKTTNYSSSQINNSTTPSFSSCSTPFQDALSIHHIEKTNTHRIILPTRPYTAPTKKLEWINYC
jgi:hypothetical protein